MNTCQAWLGNSPAEGHSDKMATTMRIISFTGREHAFLGSLVLLPVLYPITLADESLIAPVLIMFGALIAVVATRAVTQSFLLERVKLLRSICLLSALWYFAPLVFVSYSLDQNLTLSTSTEIYTAGMIVSACIIPVWLLTALEPNLPIHRDFIGANSKTITRWIVFLSAGQAALMAAGVWSYTTLYSTGADAVDDRVIYMALQPLTAVLLPLCGALLGHFAKTRKWSSLAFISVPTLIQVSWWLPVGRRLLIIQVILALLLFYSNYCADLIRRRFFIAPLIGSILIGYLSIQMFKLFYVLRTLFESNYSFSLDNVLTLFFQFDSTPDGVEFAQNLIYRPLSLIDRFAYVTNHAQGFMFGDLFRSIGFILPGFMFENKALWLSQNNPHELTWLAELSVPLRDWPETIILNSYLDFGIAGFLIYGCIFLGISFVLAKRSIVGRSFKGGTVLSLLALCLFWQIEIGQPVMFVNFRALMAGFGAFLAYSLLFSPAPPGAARKEVSSKLIDA